MLTIFQFCNSNYWWVMGGVIMSMTDRSGRVAMEYGRLVLGEGLRIQNISDGASDLLGYDKEDAANGLTLYDLLCESESRSKLGCFISDLRTYREGCVSLHLCSKSGEVCCFMCHGMVDDCGEMSLVIGDFSAEKQHYKELTFRSKCYKLLEEQTDDLYFEYDIEDDFLLIPHTKLQSSADTKKFENYWSSNLPRNTVHPDDYERYRKTWLECIDSKESAVVEFRTRLFSKDGSYEWYRLPLMCVTDHLNNPIMVFGRMASIEREKTLSRTIEIDHQVIDKLMNTDHLTGLLNRDAFKRRAAEMLDNFDENKCYSLAYADINDFSYINDNFGYQEGNKVLQHFAKLLSGAPGEKVISCRIYSDYFITFSVCNSKDEVIDIVSKVNREFSQTLKDRYPASDIFVSTGIYFFDKDNRDVTIAIDNANLARRSVKGSRDVPCGIYSDGLRRKRQREQKIASELFTALEKGEIEMFLQPKFSLRTRKVIGAETLARWRNPDGSYKLPYEFVDVLEKLGYIVELDFFIYESLLKAMKRWQELGKRLVPVSVNFSRLHNTKKDFVERIIGLADKYGVDKKLIEIEVTESVFASDSNTMLRNMTKLRQAGFRIDIDDFGIGYSSLSMLMNAPIDTVKVDKVFINNLNSSRRNREYVKQLCLLIATTNKEVVFEGVETEEQAEFISQWGFNIAQGWLFDKAISVSEFESKYLDDADAV